SNRCVGAISRERRNPATGGCAWKRPAGGPATSPARTLGPIDNPREPSMVGSQHGPGRWRLEGGLIMKRTAILTFVVCASLLIAGLPGGARADDFDTPQWTETRQALFQGRPIQEEGSTVVQLEVPLRPDDAAAVPVLIKVKSSKSPEQTVKNLYVVID